MDIARIEQAIERYVRFPETLSEERRQAVEFLLGKSTFLNTIAHHHEEFYDELDVTTHEVTPAVKDMLDRLFVCCAQANGADGGSD